MTSSGASCELVLHVAAVSMQRIWRYAKNDGMLATKSPTDNTHKDRHMSRTMTSRYPYMRLSRTRCETSCWAVSAGVSTGLISVSCSTYRPGSEMQRRTQLLQGKV